ncbi:integral membrane protein, PqiA family [Hartmannibacter diazotrophicus]|uniref:Integral membrane protein, PqiA family n=1 Tax=Hartmannibacter diazotrophicus TaxID=1482074 RepID=A0A2C9D608_9HYPH|nr:paraquat-inducible protein A [Hartmannibacter diazotrophicus]SON55599.1 integral membrane protein, PqiA family [Hartmannibacter diazotrophicus]
MQVLFALLLLVSALTFPLGATLPLLTVDRLYFFEEAPSLVAILLQLWTDGDRLLAFVVCLASLVFPLMKLTALFLGGFGAATSIVRHLHALGRWSMMDVLIVALVIFAAKTSGFATAVTQPGLWFYLASALSAALASLVLEKVRAVSK